MLILMETQVQNIELVNDGTGLGFGITGSRSSGVVVKAIIPGGVSDRDGRLQNGDHILQIGNVNLRGMTADQASQVLRQAGGNVSLIVARSVEPSSECNTFQSSESIKISNSEVNNDSYILNSRLEIDEQTISENSLTPDTVTSTSGNQIRGGFGPQMWRHGGRRRWHISQWKWK